MGFQIAANGPYELSCVSSPPDTRVNPRCKRVRLNLSTSSPGSRRIAGVLIDEWVKEEETMRGVYLPAKTRLTRALFLFSRINELESPLFSYSRKSEACESRNGEFPSR